MSKHTDMKPVFSGWYSVRFRNKLTLKQLDKSELAQTFIDWAYFDGENWDAPEYKELGFYVQNVIKLENKDK